MMQGGQHLTIMWCAQVSASAPLLQGVKRAVRVSIVAMGAAPLAPKEQPVTTDPAKPVEPKVRSCCGSIKPDGFSCMDMSLSCHSQSLS